MIYSDLTLVSAIYTRRPLLRLKIKYYRLKAQKQDIY